MAPGRPGHPALRGRDQVRPPGRHRRRAAPHQPAGRHRPARPDQLRWPGGHLGLPRAARPGGRGRRAARRSRPRRRPRPVHLPGRPVQGRLRASWSGWRGPTSCPARSSRLDDGTAVALRRRPGLGQPAGEPRSRAGRGARVRGAAAGRARPVADDPAAPVLGPAHPVDGGARTRVELGGLARTDRAGYGEEFDRLRAAICSAARRHDRRRTADARRPWPSTATGSSWPRSASTCWRCCCTAPSTRPPGRAAGRSRCVGAGGTGATPTGDRLARSRAATGPRPRRSARPDGGGAARARRRSAARLDRHPRAGRRPLAAGQHVRVHLARSAWPRWSPGCVVLRRCAGGPARPGCSCCCRWSCCCSWPAPCSTRRPPR